MLTFVRGLAFGLLLLPFCASAQSSQPPRTFSASLSAVGVTQGIPVNAKTHTVQMVVVSPGTCSLQLEGSLDGVHWANLSGAQPCLNTSPTMWHLYTKLVTFVRINLTAYAGDQGGAKVQVFYSGATY
jgi:hypothetical protein